MHSGSGLQPTRVLVESKARLHFGFLDISGSLGRRFGSVGLSINAFTTRVSAERNALLSVVGADAQRAQRYARRMLDELRSNSGVALDVEAAIPGHLGLGSGTQLALTVGTALAAVCDATVDTRQVARLLRRGSRSGIGIGAFDHGGFIVDGGVDEHDDVPPVIARLAFPNAWRILLVMDIRGQGLHGRTEADAFRRLKPFPRELAARLSHLTLMQILPGVEKARLPPVAEGIAEMQRCVGDYFAPIQGGRFTSAAVADALSYVESLGCAGVGQSSWGPTGFALLPDEDDAKKLLNSMRQKFGDLSPLRFQITSACNQGSRVEHETSTDVVEENY